MNSDGEEEGRSPMRKRGPSVLMRPGRIETKSVDHMPDRIEKNRSEFCERAEKARKKVGKKKSPESKRLETTTNQRSSEERRDL